MSSKNTGNQLKIRYKNLPQSFALKKSPTFNQNKEYFQKMLLERKKAISEVLSFKTTKKSIDNNYSYFNNLRFKADLNVLNLVNVADFSKTTLIDYIKDISSKKKLH